MSRVLWLSPWLRPLARVHAEALAAHGHEVLLVTSEQHPESGVARPYELVLVPSPKRAGSWPEWVRGRRRVKEFGPQLVVGELVRDPRWLALARRQPWVSVVHDDRPHGVEEQRPRWERALFDARQHRAAAVVTFSRHVADAVGERARVLPLPSDLDPAAVPPFAEAGERRDVVFFGRLNPYKNIDVTLAAWERHVSGPAWQGDDLLLVGEGAVTSALPPHVKHLGDRYRYTDVLPLLRRAKASLAHYRQASQSGVQVLSMQLGVVPIASDRGGLPEYQPPGESPLPVDDVAALAARLDELADPVTATRRGAAAREHYATNFAADHGARAWAALIDELARPPRPSRR